MVCQFKTSMFMAFNNQQRNRISDWTELWKIFNPNHSQLIATSTGSIFNNKKSFNLPSLNSAKDLKSRLRSLTNLNHIYRHLLKRVWKRNMVSSCPRWRHSLSRIKDTHPLLCKSQIAINSREIFQSKVLKLSLVKIN